jgi:hypothetical protein
MSTDQGLEGTIISVETVTQPVTTKQTALEAFTTSPNLPENISEHAKNVLQGMSMEDIAKFAPKVTEWDKGVAEKFRDYNEKLKAFDGLDVNEAKEAIQFNNLMLNNPAEAIKRLQNLLDDSANINVDEELVDDNDIYNQLPDSIKSKLDKVDALEQRLTNLAEKEQARQDKKDLDFYNAELNALATKHGEFDKDVITRLIASGADPEESVISWHSAIELAVQSKLKQSESAPSVIGGKSDVETVHVNNVVDMSKKDVKALMQNLLNSAKS